MPDTLPATRVPLPCPAETVVTDGKVLATILKVDDHGHYVLEDAHTELSRNDLDRLVVHARTFTVRPVELARRYRVVRWPVSDAELRAA
jgi:hypothetical protein